MKERRKRQFLPDLFYSKFFLFFCVAIFFAILFGVAKGTIKNYKVDYEVQDLQKEISNLERQNQEFSQLISYLKSENFIEQEAKLKLGLKKSGENLVVIPQIAETSQVKEGENINQQLSNPAKWWVYFFK
jgi:cell division protein FtsL